MQEDSINAADKATLVQRLFVQHAAQVRGFLVALSPDLALAEDAFQETFITVTAKAESFDTQRDFLAWACGVARLKLLEVGRRAGSRCRPLSEDVLAALSACQPPAASDDERLVHLGECVKTLAPKARQIVEMCYQQSHKPAEIARRMDWTAEAVYVALSRARAVLRQCVERKMAGTS